jgi:hypothetical protein
MAQAIDAARFLNPQVCSTVAHERFSVEQTIRRYLDVYQELADGSRTGHRKV